MIKFSKEKLFKTRDILELLPKELIKKVIGNKFPMVRRELLKLFTNSSINVKTNYPRVYESAFKDL